MSSAQTNTGSTWEQRREQERLVEQSRWDKAADALTRLGFDVLPLTDDNKSDTCSYTQAVIGVRPSDGLRVRIGVGDSLKRFEASHTLTNELIKAKDYNEPRLEIGMAWSKTPEQMAKDIARRLIPDAGAQYARVRARLAEHQAFDTAKGATYERIAKALGVTPAEWDRAKDQVTKYESGGFRLEAKVNSGNSVEIEIRYLKADQAEKILQLLANL